ncbi:MAG: DJ-1/PfpI family protein [bacterium]|nr:DJ-1/PfpI family protein [bacterium]
MQNLKGKKIAIIIAFRDFRDEEYFVPKQIFLAAGAEVKTISTKKGQAIGAYGGQTQVDLLISKINIADFDAVVFVGGSGALKYLDNEDSYKAVKETLSQDKVLGAICVAPTILAKVGVLSGKKATVWASPMDKSAVKILQNNGAIFEDKPVVLDGKIVTGSGPEAAEEFGQMIIKILTT